LPNVEFQEVVRIYAVNEGGATSFVTYTINAACDTTIAVNQLSGATKTVGPLSISSTNHVESGLYNTLGTANDVCPITGYVLKKADGSDWTNTALISVGTQTVDNKLQPQLTVVRTTEFSETIRILATNKGGSTNFITVTVSAACDTTITVNQAD
jgi:hypothetical protein